MRNIERFEKFIISQKVIVRKGEKALIMEMAMHPGKWDFPGGRIDVGEDPHVSLQRELHEETGLGKVDVGEIVAADIWFHGEAKIPVCGIVYKIETEQEKIGLSQEHVRYLWIKEDEIDEYEYIWPRMNRILKVAFE